MAYLDREYDVNHVIVLNVICSRFWQTWGIHGITRVLATIVTSHNSTGVVRRLRRSMTRTQQRSVTPCASCQPCKQANEMVIAYLVQMGCSVFLAVTVYFVVRAMVY